MSCACLAMPRGCGCLSRCCCAAVPLVAPKALHCPLHCPHHPPTRLPIVITHPASSYTAAYFLVSGNTFSNGGTTAFAAGQVRAMGGWVGAGTGVARDQWEHGWVGTCPLGTSVLH